MRRPVSLVSMRFIYHRYNIDTKPHLTGHMDFKVDQFATMSTLLLAVSNFMATLLILVFAITVSRSGIRPPGLSLLQLIQKKSALHSFKVWYQSTYLYCSRTHKIA